MTRATIEVRLSGKAVEAKEFAVELSTEYDHEDENAPQGEDLGKSVLGAVKTATVSIVSARGEQLDTFLLN